MRACPCYWELAGWQVLEQVREQHRWAGDGATSTRQTVGITGGQRGRCPSHDLSLDRESVDELTEMKGNLSGEGRSSWEQQGAPYEGLAWRTAGSLALRREPGRKSLQSKPKPCPAGASGFTCSGQERGGTRKMGWVSGSFLLCVSEQALGCGLSCWRKNSGESP